MTQPEQYGYVSPLQSLESLDKTLTLTYLPRRRTSIDSQSGRAFPVQGLSSPSDSEEEEDTGYTTNFTTPASSDSAPEDDGSDEVEDFRDREYPQLKGKVYLDHGGSTVCLDCIYIVFIAARLTILALCKVTH